MAAQKSKQASQQASSKKKDALLQEQVERASLAVDKASAASKALHDSWTTTLRNMSYLMIVQTMYQAFKNVKASMEDFEKMKNLTIETPITDQKTTTTAMIVLDSLPSLLSILMALALTAFLVDTSRPLTVSHPRFIKATACGLALLTLGRPGGIDERLIDAGVMDQPARKSFPVVLVFHAMVAISVWFMTNQRGAHEKNEQAMERLRKDVQEADKKKKK
jgi:hypothetical protein